MEEIEELFKANAVLYTAVAKAVPNNWAEKRIILEKLTEAGMWLKLAEESNRPFNPKVVVTDKASGKRREFTNDEEKNNQN